MEERYNHLNTWLKEKFGERVLKICVDGGFTCPNRVGKCGTGGCIFCGEKGSGEHLHSLLSIPQQVEFFFNSYKVNRANKFILYFQNFTNTFDTVANLKRKYDSGLIDERIVALAIATRPDEINEEKVKLIKSYSSKYYVWVELGLQTSSDKTAILINRGYKKEAFEKAIKLLNKYDIDVVVHLMVGLPGENFNDLKMTVEYINKFNIKGIKIHSTYVMKNTVLEDMYKNKLYTPITLDEYVKACGYIISHINKKIIIHRISGDAPKELLVAPLWNSHKKIIINEINKYLNGNNIWQGKDNNN